MSSVINKYEIKSEIDHILDRPGMYMGSTSTQLQELWLYQPSSNAIAQVKNQSYNAGLMKIIDEILSNSVDEHRRLDSLFPVDKIEVNVNSNGRIIIKDNGGIPVEIHKKAGILIPQLIFGQLRTSSNYDDTKERNVIGTNGLGAKLTNIFSKSFKVTTCDGKQKVTVTWTNNMKDVEVSKITKSTDHYTEIDFQIDLDRFDTDQLCLSDIRQINKRCIDGCAVNPGLTILFETNIAEGKLNSSFNFPSFFDYAKMYLLPEQYENVSVFKSQKFHIGISNVCLGTNIAFVNGALCSRGTHIKILQKQIVDKILEFCKKNGMELFTEKDIVSKMTLFVNSMVKNPTYDSQTKECLTNKLSVNDLKINDKFLNELLESPLIDTLKDFYKVRYAAIEKKEIANLNKAIRNTKTKKLIASTSNSSEKSLWLFEGTSASNGFRKYRNPQTQSAYLLRGKVKNSFSLNRTQIVENQELREIIATLGLLFNEPQKNIKNLKYSKIVISTDSDYDGHHITGLIIAFFIQHFPEIIRAKKLYRALSPIIICQNVKTKEKHYYYTLEEFHKEEKKFNKDYEIRYTKGLGGLDDNDYKIMLRQQKLIQFNIEDAKDIESVAIWFEKSSEQRKLVLMEAENE